MKVVHKYELFRHLGIELYLNLPKYAQILKIALQGEALCVWVLVDRAQKQKVRRAFMVFGTGHDNIPDYAEHIETVFDGPFVWHIFEV